MKLRIKEVIEHAPKIKSLIFDTQENPIEFKAGQFLLASAEVHGHPVSRAYSICTTPSTKDKIEILFKVYDDGQLTPTLNSLRTGDYLEVKAPFGQFIFDENNKRVALIAGGTGIAPILCFVRVIAENKLPIETHLFFGARNREELVYRTELQRISEGHPNINLHFTIDNPEPGWDGRTGFPSYEWIQSKLKEVDNVIYYLCGPRVMVDKLHMSLKQAGIDNKKIRADHW